MKPWEKYANAEVSNIKASAPQTQAKQEKQNEVPWMLEWSDPEIAQLKQDEGYRDVKYKDSGKGVETIGYGTAATGGRKIPDKIDKLTAEQWLIEDVYKARQFARKELPDAPVEVRSIVTNMVYQMGPTGVKGFKNTMNAIKEGKYEEAAEHMLDSDWARTYTTRAERLAERMRSVGSRDKRS